MDGADVDEEEEEEEEAVALGQVGCVLPASLQGVLGCLSIQRVAHDSPSMQRLTEQVVCVPDGRRGVGRRHAAGARRHAGQNTCRNQIQANAFPGQSVRGIWSVALDFAAFAVAKC
eukprot:1337479-Rhodomonas_salina.1